MPKKILFISLTLLLFTCSAKAQTSWIKFKLDEQVTLNFPAAPAKVSANSYMYASKDSSVVLICEIHSEGDEDADTPPFIEFLPPTDPSAKDAEPTTTTAIKTGTLKGYNTTKSTMVMPTKRLSIYTIQIKSKGYMLGALLSKNIDEKVAEDFFSSVVVGKGK
jgi:hypothetical protein